MERSRSRTSLRGGFTLIELLVVVAVVGVLISLLVGGLSRVRDIGRDAVCLSNQRQLAVAWHAFVTSRGVFPNYDRNIRDPRPTVNPPFSNGWGGAVTWINPAQADQLWNRANPPINEYLQVTSPHFLFEVYHCPRDTGAVYAGSGLNINQGFQQSWFLYPEWLHSAFGVRGNSYTSNDWVWARVGSINGAGPNFTGMRRWAHNNRPDTVLVNPSLTVMLGDFASLEPGVLTEEQYTMTSQPVGWWHGYRESNIAFWDGSARRVSLRPGSGYQSDYWLWLMPERHDPTGTPIARLHQIRNPPPGGAPGAFMN